MTKLLNNLRFNFFYQDLEYLFHSKKNEILDVLQFFLIENYTYNQKHANVPKNIRSHI